MGTIQFRCEDPVPIIGTIVSMRWPSSDHWNYIVKMQGQFQDFFQGVAEISSGGGENLPEGGEKI